MTNAFQVQKPSIVVSARCTNVYAFVLKEMHAIWEFPRNSAFLTLQNLTARDMTRRKVDRGAKLSRIVRVRISESFYGRMQEWLANSNCQNMGELTRAILYREKINWYHKDATLESTAIELAGIKRELNDIGRNINQITHHFHTSDMPSQKVFAALKVVEEYKKVGAKVDKLLSIAADISKKWLQSK